MLRKTASAGATIAALVLLQSGVPAGQQTTGARPQFRSGVDLVMVDASVLGRNRQPIRGLDVSKFTVLEDGRVQPVVTFSEVEVPGPDVLPTGWMREVAPDVETNSTVGSRLFLLLLDDAQIQMSPYETSAVKAIGHAIVDSLGPDDLAALVFTRDSRGALDFTSDRTRLRAMIDRFRGGANPQLGFLFARYSTGALKAVAQHLGQVRDRRKAIIYVSTGVAGVVGSDPPDREVRYRLHDAIHEAQRANVPVYTINPSGLTNLDWNAIGDAIREGTRPDVAVQAAWDTLSDTNDFLQVVAANTGGFALATSDFAGGVAQIFRENASYYLLGFKPTAPPDGKLRRIEVRVDHPGITVRARSGYSDPRPPRPGREPAATTAAIAGLIPRTDVQMRAAFAPFAVAGRKKAAVLVALGLRRAAPAEAMTERARLLVRAFTPTGQSLTGQTLEADLVLRPSGTNEAKYELFSRLDLAPGRYAIRISAESLSLNQSGSVYADVVVPDFAKEPLSLSGAVIGATPPLPSAGEEALGGLIPVVPTTQREFAGHEGTAFVRVYQGGGKPLATVTLAIRVVDAAGTPVFERAEELGPERFGGARAADYSLDLPLRGLTAGAYLLTFEATAGAAAAKRDVRFDVQ